MSTGNGTRFSILRPMMQGGFAGMCGVLLGILVWMMNKNDQRFDKLLEMQSQTNQVIERNTAAIVELSRVVHSRYGGTP